ncbi:copper amine oxidase N-terminal domain-containing protein [Paenibacillus sp. HB172176]|uniref:copper amine oxidase N-terminal domain-containing protein n=1 Tax=Paenibacillus sp. HB172176 TaxID=2493690 RepID=UPI001980DC88|nr:copper amine oxidase N-terminal domain-containing protein [Paenibacillus sp. HB172176]
MRSRVTFFIFGFICSSMLGASVIFAADSAEIKVYFTKLTYMFNGVEKLPEQAGEGFIYNDTTYVPLRFVAESLGQEVKWDGNTETIWLSRKAEDLTMSDLSITDITTHNTIQLGMTRDEAEEILGESSDLVLGKLYNYNGLWIFYRDNVIAGMMVNAGSNETNRYRTSKNIGLGNNMEDALSQYGNGFIDQRSSSVTYYYELTEGVLNKEVEMVFSPERSNTYTISIGFFENDARNISSILIGDYYFATTVS